MAKREISDRATVIIADNFGKELVRLNVSLDKTAILTSDLKIMAMDSLLAEIQSEKK